MQVLRTIKYNNQRFLVVADENGLAIEDREEMSFYADKLKETCKRFTDKEIFDINNGLLKDSYSSLYSEVYEPSDE